MAEKSLTFNLFGHDVTASKAVGEFTDKVNGHISGIVGNLGKIATGFFALGGIVEFGKSTVEATMAAEASNVKLDQALKNVHSSLNANSDSVVALKSHMADYGFTDAQVADALAKATTGLGDSSKAMQIMQVSADLAKYKNIDLSQAVLVVTRGMEGQLRPLRQLGIDLPVAAGNAQAVAVAQKKLADAQSALNDLLAKHPDAVNAASKAHAAYETALKKVDAAQENLKTHTSAGQTILDTLSSRLKGQAADAADTYAGKLAALNAKWDDFQVKIGTAVMPALGGLLDLMNKGVLPAFEKLGSNLDQVNKGKMTLGQAFTTGVTHGSGGYWGDSAGDGLDHSSAIGHGAAQMTQFLTNGFGGKYDPKTTGNGPLDLKSWTNGWNQMMAAFSNGWDQLISHLFSPKAWENGWNQLWSIFNSQWNRTTGMLGNGWDQLISHLFNPKAWENGWNQITGRLANGWSELMGRFASGWNQWMGMFANGWNQIVGAFAHGWSQIAGGWNDLMGKFANGWNQWMSMFSNGWNQIIGAFSHGWDQITGAFKHGIDQISEAWKNIIGAFVNGWNQIQSFITGHPVHGTIQYQNIVPAPPGPSAAAATNGGRAFPLAAAGGVVRPRPGGTPVVIGEAGASEVILPLTNDVFSQLAAAMGGGGGNTYEITVNEVTDPVGTAHAVQRLLNMRAMV